MSELVTALKKLLRDVTAFCEHASGLKLRSYQVEIAERISLAVIQNTGETFVIILPRQSGKNELQAQLETYIMTLLSQTNAEIVKASPTWKPQSLNAMRRLERVLSRNIMTRGQWKKEQGYIYRVGNARIYFFSASPQASILGATASTLLEVDEAQDVLPAKFDKDLSPMTASTNACRALWGTNWTSTTLLAREKRAALAQQARDGRRRVWELTADDVGAEVPAYKAFVEAQIAKLGRDHPFVRTQLFSEEIDAEGGMFPPSRRQAMQGTHAQQTQPSADHVYALCIDVAGEDEGASIDPTRMNNPRRDSTALTIFDVDISTCSDPVIQRPRYFAAQRKEWMGVKHTSLYGKIRTIVDAWQPRYVVIDATGVGAGLTSFLAAAYPDKVIPFTFNTSSKSKLGWDFLAICDTGRFQDYVSVSPSVDPFLIRSSVEYPLTRFVRQLEACKYEVIPGPGQILKWGVPESARDPSTGDLIHDDLLLSAALCAVLDEQDWTVASTPMLIHRADPLTDIDQAGIL